MIQSPIWLDLAFILMTLAVSFSMYRMMKHKAVLIGMILLIAISFILGVSGVLYAPDAFPPRLPLIVLPSLAMLFLLFFTKKGISILNEINLEKLTYIHVIRVPVELGLLALFIYGYVPESMTFEGRNFDIVSGITAPVIAYYGYRKRLLPQWIIACWNIVCLALVLQVVITGILSAPNIIQSIDFKQPNIAVLYFPYIWLPAVIVPSVIFVHLASLRAIYKSTSLYKSTQIV